MPSDRSAFISLLVGELSDFCPDRQQLDQLIHTCASRADTAPSGPDHPLIGRPLQGAVSRNETLLSSLLDALSLSCGASRGRVLMAFHRAAEALPQHNGPDRNVRRNLLAAVASLKDREWCIEYCPGRLDPSEISDEMLYEVHRTGWPEGLSPPEQMLRVARKSDLIFGAFDTTLDGRLCGVVHARILDKGSPFFRGPAEQADFGLYAGLNIPRLREQKVVFYAAVTHESYRGMGLTGKLIKNVVLPWLDRQELTQKLGRLTVSPLTYFVTNGRSLTGNQSFPALLEAVDLQIRRIKSPLFPDLRTGITRASAHLQRCGFKLTVPPGANPRDFFDDLYKTLPTHSELVGMRRKAKTGDIDAEREWNESARRVIRLYSDIEGADEKWRDERRAAVVLIQLAACLTQAGVRKAHDGAPLDEIIRFHTGNGGFVHPTLGPVLGSNPIDIAALALGQVLVYDEQWRDRLRHEMAQRRHLVSCYLAGEISGIQIDLGEAICYLGQVLPLILAA